MALSSRSIATPFDPIGRVAISWVNNLGAAAIFFGRAFLLIFRGKQISPIIEQVSHIGAKTTGIVSLIGLFTGMVMALQIYHALAEFGAEGRLGSVVTISSA